MPTKDRSHIEPTLFIGLGGSGGRVLGRLRKMFRDQCQADGGKNSPVQFLLIDTDDFRKLDESVSGSLSEQEEFISISHFNPRQYLDEQRRDHRSDLHRWFDWETRPLIEDAFVRDGASRLRMLGRLCLHRSYFKVEQLIAAKLEAAKSAQAQLEGGRSIRVSQRPVRVMLLGSTCGGTGSSIFLDLVHMVNQLVRNTGATPDVVGYLFLPFRYIEHNRQIDTDLVPYYQANAWAFFEELNHVLLQPTRLAEMALDPRRANGEPADLERGDYEPLKTVFLIDSEIPNVGTFTDDGGWYAYVAQGIFHVFLAPEEGNLESIFSNVKVKLAEKDLRHGLKKRFATFGYADLRHPGDNLRRYLGFRTALRHLDRCLVRAADSSDVSKAVDELYGAIDQACQSATIALTAVPVPSLLPNRYMTAQGPGKQVANIPALNGITRDIGAAVDAFNDRLPDRRLLANVVRRLVQDLEARAGAMPLGAAGEQEVMRRLAERLRSEAGSTIVQPGTLTINATGLAGARTIQNQLASKSVLGRWGGPPTDAAPYLTAIGQINASLQQQAESLLETEVASWRAYVLQSLAGTDASGINPHETARTPGALARIAERHERLRSLLAQMHERFADHWMKRLEGDESLTTRFYPEIVDLGAVWERYQPACERVLVEQAGGVQRAMEEAIRHILDSTSEPRENQRVHDGVQKLADFVGPHVQLDDNMTELLRAAVKELNERIPTTDGGFKQPSELAKRCETMMRNVYALSMPCCKVDEAKLAPGDTMPRAFVVSADGLEEDEARLFLQLPVRPEVLDNDGHQVALLQAVYAFPSHAVAGMDALREAYERRDRSRSYPHVDREWNRTGLQVSTRGALHDAELLQFARVRALSDLFADAPANGSGPHVPGLRLLSQGRRIEREPLWMLRYQQDVRSGRPRLQVRDVDPVPHSVRSWIVADDCEDLYELDIDENIRRYAACTARDGHERMLATDIQELERGEFRDEYVGAYERYLQLLDRNVQLCRTEGRTADEVLFSRMANVLHSYVDGLKATANVATA